MFSEILWLWLNMIKFCQYSTKLIITWITVSLVFKNVLIRTAVLFSEILWLWLNMIKFCQYSTKLIITWIIVSLVFKNVLIRTAVLFSDILWLWLNMIKFCQYSTKLIITWIIVSLVFKKCSYKDCCIVFRDFMTLVKHDQILSVFNQAYYYMNYCVFSV